MTATTPPAAATKSRTVPPPTALVLRLFLLASFLWFAIPWLFTLSTVNGTTCFQPAPAATRHDLASIRNRLAAGDAQRMHHLFPEGRLFSYSFYGFTLINLATANPHDTSFRNETLEELERL